MINRYFSKENVESILNGCLNKTFSEVDRNKILDRAIENPKITGIAGDIIEQSVLECGPNTKQEPDLNVDGVETELKTTGLRKSKKKNNTLEAKEPMSITAVSPNKIVNEEFYTSAFWHKLENMLIVYYFYDSDETVKAIDYGDFPIIGYDFFKFNDDEINILKSDWTIVKNFIKHLQNEYSDYENEYPRLSHELRNQLMFIDTAPKWPNNPRFRLKRSVVTSIFERCVNSNINQQSFSFSTYDELDKLCNNLTKLNKGKTIKELIEKYGISYSKINKAVCEKVIVKMFSSNYSKINSIDIFKKVGIIGKTITITKDNNRTEDMKLFSIDFSDICNLNEYDEETGNKQFEYSQFYEYFANHQLLCAIFEEPSLDSPLTENKFLGFKRYSFNEELLTNHVELVWNNIRELIKNNELKEEIVYKKNGKKIINPKTKTIKTTINFPKSKEFNVFVRGTGVDANDKKLSINGIKMYDQWIWIKGKYIVDELKKVNYL